MDDETGGAGEVIRAGLEGHKGPTPISAAGNQSSAAVTAAQLTRRLNGLNSSLVIAGSNS
jgi:hypothetical protein